jgi:predicted alpha/beta superfamily hydrolase
MARVTEAELDGKVVKVYRAGGENLPVVYSNDYQENGEAVLARCAEIGCPPFHLVTMSKVGWDRSMSPWPSAPVVARNDHFTGEGPAHLEWLLEKTVPHAERVLGVSGAMSFISGYSMAGLFALWAIFQTDFFAGAVSASGSVWFPGFREFALGHEPAGSPRGVYLSLGDRETKVSNPALQHTDETCREIRDHLEEAGVPAKFELNPGNHYRDMDVRVAKGIAWLLADGK